MTAPWSADLEAALLREIARGWRRDNQDLFQGSLRPPTFALSDGGVRIGAWVRGQRQIRIARSLVRTGPWLAVVEVLRHEMAHQYVDEVLGVRDEPAHGPAFRRVCAERGIDATAAGLLTGDDRREDRLIRRIQKLLALADSPNEAEAALAARKAYALMVEHNVRWAQTAETPRFVVRQIGPIKQRFTAVEKVLAGLLGAHFFVTPIFTTAWDVHAGRGGRVLEISGTLENVRMAEHVHAWLADTGERLWTRYRARHRTGRTDKRRFLLGLLHGFDEQLRDQQRACAETGLVWVGDPHLEDFVRRRHPHLIPGRAVAVHTTGAWGAGREEGRRIRLHKPVESTATDRGRRIEQGGPLPLEPAPPRPDGGHPLEPPHPMS